LKRLLKIVGVVLGVALFLHGAAFLLVESGEVVVLRTDPARDHRLLARLWVVDHDGRPWVGTANPSETRWVAALRANPRIELTRGDFTDCRTAVYMENQVLGANLTQLVNAKYRIPLYGSRFLKFTQRLRLDDAAAVWFRLDPCSVTE
jgi:hypothetical protein